MRHGRCKCLTISPLTALALAQLETLDENKLLPHEHILEKFGK
jgi:hypothetical protein